MAIDSKKEQPNYQVRAISRALDILKSFSVDKPERSLTNLSEITGLNKSTLIRLLTCLIQEGFIEQSSQNDKYKLGIKTFEVGMIYYITQLQINVVAKPYMAQLANKIHLTINLAILDNGEIVYVGIEEPNKIIRIRFSLGSRLNIHCTSLGKVLVSQLSEEMIDQIIIKKGLPKFAKNTITSDLEFKKQLEIIKEQGYAEDNEEAVDGIRCIGVPIYDYSGKIVAAISASGAVFEVNDKKIEEIISEVKNTALTISEKLGYNPSRLINNF